MAVVYSAEDIRLRHVPSPDAQPLAAQEAIAELEKLSQEPDSNISGAMIYGSALVNMAQAKPNPAPGVRRDVDILVTFTSEPTDAQAEAVQLKLDGIHRAHWVVFDLHTLSARTLHAAQERRSAVSFERDQLLAHHLKIAEAVGKTLVPKLAFGESTQDLQSIGRHDDFGRQIEAPLDVLAYFRDKRDTLLNLPRVFDEQSGLRAFMRLLEMDGAVLRKLHDAATVAGLIEGDEDGLPLLTSRADNDRLAQILDLGAEKDPLRVALAQLKQLNVDYEAKLAYANADGIDDAEREHRIEEYMSWIRTAYPQALKACKAMIPAAIEVVKMKLSVTGEDPDD